MWSSQIARELRQGVRRLIAAPIFTIFSITTLAVAIGVTTAAYSVIERALDRDVGVRDPDQLVGLYRNGWPGATVSWPDYRDLVEQQRSLGQLAAWLRGMTSIGTVDESSLQLVEAVSGAYFETVGGRALVGRLLSTVDDRADAPPAVVLSENLWRDRFGAAPDIVGRSLLVAGQPATVVGVAPVDFRGMSGQSTAVGFWIPLSLVPQMPGILGPGGFVPENRRRPALGIAGRLDPALSIEQAAEDVRLIGERLDATYQPPADVPPPYRWRNWSLGPAFPPRGELSNPAWASILLPGMVFLIACTNLANLALSRSISRRNAIAVRSALGAPRWRLVREEMAEATIIATAGALAGIAVARALLATGLQLLQTYTAVPPYLLPLDLAISPSVVVPIVATTVLSLVVGGLLPALQISRTSVRQTLATDADTAVPRWRGRRRLIALQVAASVGLFLTAFAASRALVSMRFPDMGAAIEDAALAAIPFGQQGYDEARARDVVDRVLAELQRVPGVRATAGAGGIAPRHGLLPSSYNRVLVARPDTPFSNAALGLSPDFTVGTPDLFRTIGLPFVNGRSFEPTDGAGAPPVTVIDESLAVELFGSANAALGQPLLVRVQTALRTTHDTTRTVIGVVSSRHNARSNEPINELYVPFAQFYDPNVIVVARADDGAPVAAMHDALRRADASVATTYLGDSARVSNSPQRVFRAMAILGNALAAFALVLSMAGLYGVLSHVVAKRTRELAVRSALGANAGRILRLVLRDGLRPVMEGLALGLVGAMLLRQILRIWVIDNLSAIDPLAFGLVTMLLVSAGLAACYAPARRASRVDPNVALRES